MRGLILLALVGVVATSCDRIRALGATAEAEPQLALSLEMSDVLDWGGVSDVELTLTNQGSVPIGDIDVELYFPSWLEFSSVEPADTEVSLLSTGGETRLAYGLGSPPLQPGETRMIVQSVRVPPRGAAADVAVGDTSALTDAPATADTTAADTAAAAVEPVPTNRTLRARLVDQAGEQLGAEVSTLMPFRGADNTAALPVGGTADEAVIESEGIGPVRLGAAVADLRAALPAARDTTFTIGDSPRANGLVVPLGTGSNVLVATVDDGVDRIIVRDAGIQTQLGHGVGSTFQQLRQAYGNHCTSAASGSRVAVRFPNLRGVSFIFDAPAKAADTAAAGALGAAAAVPDGAQVRELWVQRGPAGC